MVAILRYRSEDCYTQPPTHRTFGTAKALLMLSFSTALAMAPEGLFLD